jgi:CBS domain-containing protein
VAEVMTRDVVALPDVADEAAFATLMAETGVKSIPVVRGEQLVGIVGRRDLLRLLARDDADLAGDLEALLAAEAPALGQWQVAVRDGEATLTGTRGDEHAAAVELLAKTVPGVVRVHVHTSD